MRTRDLKPGFFKNEVLGQLPPLARLYFQGLWLCADREGRLEDRPVKWKGMVLPFDDLDAEATVEILKEKDFLVRYQVNGVRFLQITNFLRHQNPHWREPASEFPPPSVDEASTAMQSPSIAVHGPSMAVHTPSRASEPGTNPAALSSLSAPLQKEEEKNKTPQILQSEALAAARLLSESVRMVNPKHRELQEPRIEGTLERWARDLDLLNRRDKQSWEDIERVIKWLPDDEFWPHVILSGRNVRKHWDKLWEKATRKGPAELAKLMKGLCKCPQ